MRSYFVRHIADLDETRLQKTHAGVQAALDQDNIGLLTRCMDQLTDLDHDLAIQLMPYFHSLTITTLHHIDVAEPFADDFKDPQHADLEHLLKAAIAFACAEILDERGQIKNEIANRLKLTSLKAKWKEKSYKPFVICAFVTAIIVNTLQKNWIADSERQAEFISALDRKILTDKLFDAIANADFSDIANTADLKKAIAATRNNKEYTSILQTDATHLPLNIAALVMKTFESYNSGLTSLFNTLMSKQKPDTNALKTSLLGILNATFNSEITEKRAFAIGLTLKQINAGLDNGASKLITSRINDFNRYGRPLVDNYASTLMSTSHMHLVVDLKEYLHLVLTAQDAKSKKRSLENFISKTLFIAYAYNLNPSGDLREMMSPVRQDNECEQFVFYHAKKLLITVIESWLNAYFFESELEASTLNVKLAEIEARLTKGLSEEFLARIQGFPVFGNKDLAKKLALSFTSLPASTPVTETQSTVALVANILRVKAVCTDINTYLDKDLKQTAEEIQTGVDSVSQAQQQSLANKKTFNFYTQYSNVTEEIQKKFALASAFHAQQAQHATQLKGLAVKLSLFPSAVNSEDLSTAAATFAATKKTIADETTEALAAIKYVSDTLIPWTALQSKLEEIKETCTILKTFVQKTKSELHEQSTYALSLKISYLISEPVFMLYVKEHKAAWLNQQETLITSAQSRLEELYKPLKQALADLTTRLKSDSIETLTQLDLKDLEKTIKSHTHLIAKDRTSIITASAEIKAFAEERIIKKRKALPVLEMIINLLIARLKLVSDPNDNRIKTMVNTINAEQDKQSPLDVLVMKLIHSYQTEVEAENKGFFKAFRLFKRSEEVLVNCQIVESMQIILKENLYDHDTLLSTLNAFRSARPPEKKATYGR